ncbi:tetratricopeptide repeat protein [Nitrosomonas sp.]|uniref:tetratricopeptide repeat protein n=1 Tax=Nitrosomonas sp. TaxID=42353 RepID=UPI0026053FBA|nr:tetratricopeptide repeat protein [Nitrosomonas sp.]
MKNALLIFLCMAMLSPEENANAQTDNTQIMKDAQAALAAGDYEKAFAEYHAAANDDKNVLAQFSLGLFYQNGWGRAVDKAIACQWFEQAAQGGIPTAQHLTGICFEEGIHRPANPAAAANWFQKSAQAGHTHSYCHLGNLYMTGKGFPKDPIKALTLCHPAAEQGAIPAQIWMGKFYLQGDASIQDMQKAYLWFEAAAQKQSPEAFYYLGIIMDKGLSQGHTPRKARQMFEQAAALKYVPAYFQTGKHFFDAEPDPGTNQLSAEHLAKAYVWLSATVQRSENPEEISAAKEILQQILAVMPTTWLAELDHKVAQHLLESH